MHVTNAKGYKRCTIFIISMWLFRKLFKKWRIYDISPPAILRKI